MSKLCDRILLFVRGDYLNIKDCCVLIPSLSPDERLTRYAGELLEAGFGALIVVDDGSAEKYQPLFSQLEEAERCFVLHHEVNKGKGAALRTGMEYIYQNTAFAAVVTADSDGQHRIDDTIRLCESLEPSERVLILGSRDFSRESKGVPARSKVGNRITSAVFKVLYGPYLPDTQTGLRAFSRELIPEFLKVSGDRFEYEMNQLIYAARNSIGMKPMPIETVYIQENDSSHFHPVRDSWRIYKLIFGSFFKFALSSIICWAVDVLLYTLLDSFILPGCMDPNAVIPLLKINAVIFVATYGARFISSALNFQLNEKIVFSLKKCKGAVWRYVLLVIVVALMSSLMVSLFNRVFPAVTTTWFKIPVDFLLFLLNYRIQRDWVFRTKDE